MFYLVSKFVEKGGRAVFQVFVKFDCEIEPNCGLTVLLYASAGWSSRSAYYTEIFTARRKSFRIKMQMLLWVSTRL
jgi:hypothetical protein